LEVGVRKIEYASDALEQYSRRENVRITGIPEGEGIEEKIFVNKDILVISVFQVFASRQKFNLQSSVHKPHNDLAILSRAFYS
jgi:vacuolar-type H+-ATPase subunit B/Vma2